MRLISVDTFTARVAHARSLTHDVRQLDLTLIEPARIDFTAGQFVSFEIDRPGARFPATRAYSIASPPQRADTIALVVNRVPDGTGSSYLFDLQEGDVTTFRGPVGSFVLRDGPRDLLFVATGTGIAPFRSMLWSLAAERSARNITLYWGLRSERDLYYQDELERLREHLPNFSFITTLSQPSAEWRGAAGRVSPLVESRITEVGHLEVFLCGNGGMIRDVREILRRTGLCPIRVEQYYDDRAA